MPGKAIGIMLNNGYAGTVSRTADQVIQNRIAKTDIAFGQAGQSKILCKLHLWFK